MRRQPSNGPTMRAIQRASVGGAVAMVTLLIPAFAAAQFINNPLASTKAARDARTAAAAAARNQNGGAVIPQTAAGAGGSNLTAEQIQSIYAYRGLKSRVGGSVQRGVPQFVPLGMGFSPFPRGTQAFNPQQAGAQPQSSRQRRLEASRAAARQRRAEAEAAKAKRNAAQP